MMTLDLELPRDAKLSIKAAPVKYPDFVQVELSQPRSRNKGIANCEVAWMINGQRVTVPAAETVPHRTLEPDLLRIRLPREVATELAAAQQMALKVCDQRFSLQPDHLALVQEFAVAFAEEIAWAADEKSGALNLVAPAGGWPVWSETSFVGRSSTEPKDLTGEQLFALVSPSVHEVRVQRAVGAAQGSAVAVGEHTLLTNCHVVAGALKLAVRSGETSYAAKIYAADPASDRCVLEVPDLRLLPVRGFRKFSELKVGEVAYAIGTPQGLEKTLGSGDLSGLRQMEGQPFIQTSAPVSSGSSGGGLFDARGNLLGITTWVHVNSKGVVQSLNFAIPADRFLTQGNAMP